VTAHHHNEGGSEALSGWSATRQKQQQQQLENRAYLVTAAHLICAPDVRLRARVAEPESLEPNQLVQEDMVGAVGVGG
jgi:hypothetical protein